MSVFGPNHSGDLLVGSAYGTSTDSVDFIQNAADGEVQAFASNDSALAEGVPFKILQKSASAVAGIEFSEVIDPKSINHIAATAYSAPVQRSIQVEGFTGTVRDNVTYEVFVRLYNDGGTLSPENFRIIPAFYVTPQDASTLTFTDVLNGLKENLDKTLAKEGSNLFTTSVDTGNGYFIVEGNNRSFVLGKKDGRPVEFDLTASVRDNGSKDVLSGARYEDLEVVVTEPGNPGSGTGVQAANLEWFYKGYKYSRYRNIAEPASFNTPYEVDASNNYAVVILSYYKERSYVNVEKQHRVLYVLFEVATSIDNAAVNSFIADLETVSGRTIGALPLV